MLYRHGGPVPSLRHFLNTGPEHSAASVYYTEVYKTHKTMLDSLEKKLTGLNPLSVLVSIFTFTATQRQNTG